MAKSIDVGQAQVLRLIGHRVPRKKGKDDPRRLTLTEVIPDLPDKTLEFFGVRMKKSLSAKGQDVEVDERLGDPPLPKLLTEFLREAPRDLVATSKSAAEELYRSQGGSRYEDESLFLTLDVSLGGQPAVAVMKLEKESGVEWNEETTPEGESVLMVEVNPRLFLTDNTRVFKAALFALVDGKFVGVVSDDQQGDPTDVADYFMRRFLGCRPRRSAAVTTQGFYRTVARFVDKDLTDPEEKARVDTALKAEVNSNRPRIAPTEFVSEHVPEEHQDRLLQRLRDAEIPTTTFTKDVSRLGNAPSRTKWTTASGITIAGNVNDMAERVRPDVDEDGTPIIIVRDTLTSAG